jgi:NADPH:quinone reductase-like Zn-dependent oxidoreductase
LQFDLYGRPDVLHIAEQVIPRVSATDVLVRVHAATVGWGDCKLRAGLLRDFYRIDLPKAPGRYGSGIVAAVGSDVTNVRVGDSVVVAPLHTDNGSAAEYVRVASDKIAAKPGNLDHIQAASMIQGAVSAYACLVETAQVSAGQNVLIHGAAGSIGSACVELARHLGASVTVTCREVDRDYVHSLGAQRVVAFDREQFVKLVSDQDTVIDLVGGDVHIQSHEVLRKGGRLVYLNASQTADVQSSDGIRSLNAVVSNRGTLLEAVCRLAERGVFRPKVGKVLALEEGATAHRLLEQGAVKRGRIVLKVANG